MQGVREDESGSEIAQIQSQAQDFQSVIPAEKWEILLMSETTTDAGELEIDNSKLDTLKARRSFRGELSQKKMKGVSEDELESEEYPPTITDHLLVPEAEIIPDELAVDDTILQTLKARRSFRGELSQKKMKGVDEDEGEHSVQLQENEVTTAAIAEIMVNNLSIDDNHGTDDIAGPNGTENDVDPAKLEFLYSTRGRLSAKKLSGYQEEDEEVPVVKNSTLDNSLLDLDDEPDEGTIQIKMKGVDEDEGEYSVQLQENEVTTAAIAEIMVNNLSIDDNHGTDDIAGPNGTENDVDPAKLEFLYSTRGRLSAKKLSGYQEEDEEVPVVKKSTIENSLLDLDDEPDEGTIQKMTESSELEPSAVTNLLGDDEEDATSQLKIENLKSRRSFRGELSTKRMSGLSEEAEAGSPKPSLIQNLRNSITSLMRKGSKDLGSHFSLEKESAVPAEGSLPKANILDSEESDNIPTVQHKKARSFTDDASRVM